MVEVAVAAIEDTVVMVVVVVGVAAVNTEVPTNFN